jgi:TolB-like protein
VRGRACRAKRSAAAADAVLWERLRETLAFALDALVFRLFLPCYIPFAEAGTGKVLYLFEDYALDSKRRELRHKHHLLSVEPKVFDLLLHLVSNRERVVSKDDLVAAIWNGRIVSDSALTTCINAARTAVGDSGDIQRLIKTLPRKGLRFVGQVRERQEIAAAADDAFEVPTSPLALPDKPSIAVLPFTNMSGDAEQEYFADGIAEEITMALARLRGFFVISRNSAFTYKGKPVNVQQVGRELGVQYVLEGSVRKSGDRVRIGVQLANAVTGREFWSARYERGLVDVFAVQDEITASIVMAVEPQIYAAERERVQQKPPGRLDAWDCVIRAMSHMWLHTKDSHEAALDLLTSALRLDPAYARALGLHAWLSLWHMHQGWSTAGLTGVLPAAFEQALAAVRIDGEDAWAHLSLGFAHSFRREHDYSVEQLRTALDLNPNFAVGHACLGLTLAYGGKGHEGVQHFERQARLNPRDPFFFLFTGARSFAHFMAGEYELGLEWGRRAVRHSPEVSGHWRALALSAAMLNLAEEARTAVAMARKFQPDYSVAWVERASPLVHADDRERYCNILRPFGLPESSEN